MMGADFYQTVEAKEADVREGRPKLGVGRSTNIERAIIDKNARIGRGVTIHSHEGDADRDEELYSIRDGIVVIPKYTTIPDGMEI